jgi:hypothetical protein
MQLDPNKILTESEEEINFLLMHQKSTIDVTATVDRPPLAISIGLDDKSYGGHHYPLRFGTFGNISLIKGEEKVRKSFLKSLILACSIGGRANEFSDDIQGHDLSDKYIVDIDTEQDEYDAWLNATRIPKMVGAVPPNYLPIMLREHSPHQRRQYLEWLFMESEYRNKLGIVSLDGYVDFVKSFNDEVGSSEFTQDLMRYSSIAKCHITGVLHLNPGTTKARGHLGTILQQKCETVVVIKDLGEYSEIICQRGRGKKFQNFALRIDDNWLPYVSDDDILSGSQNALEL